MSVLAPSKSVQVIAPPAPVFPVRAGCRWHVLHTKSRQEKALAETLEAMAATCFLPLTTQKKYHGKRKVQVELPLFPGYLFLYGTMDEAYEADRTKRVARIIAVSDQAKLDEELRSLCVASKQPLGLDPFSFLVRNVRVQVTAGPLKGVRGVIQDRTKRDRLILQVGVLGQATSLEIDGSLLEVVD